MNILESIRTWLGSDGDGEMAKNRRLDAAEQFELRKVEKRAELESLDNAIEIAQMDKAIKEKRAELKRMGVSKRWSNKAWAFMIVGIIVLIFIIAKAC